MEQEHHSLAPKLIDIVKRDFPESSNVGVSFPEKWEHVETIKTKDFPLYVAGFPFERAFNRHDHFEGLPPEINVDLVFYRLYKCFQPWPMPEVIIEWEVSQPHGRVKDFQGYKLQLQPVGQAQAWFGLTHAMLWECYFDESRRFENWQETLEEVWKAVEKDVGTDKFFTAPHEPAFPQGYRDFLKGMGYSKDKEYPVWWSKTTEKSNRSAVTSGVLK